MYTTTIAAKSNKLTKQITEKINNKTKPLGSLGVLEDVALQIGLIQNTTNPTIQKPSIVVFAADHGVTKNNSVSPFPQEVTQQMVLNFLNGGAAINVFCKQNNINLTIVDSGVNAEFEKQNKLIDAKIGKGTKDFTLAPAMSIVECKKALDKGREITNNIYNSGSNCIGFGEMGIGNTSSAALLMSHFTETTIKECVGKGTGLDDEGVLRKTKILEKAIQLHSKNILNPLDALACFGGFEIVMMCGAILEAAKLKMIIIIDGFIVTAALLAASKINKNVLDYCIFCHTSGEKGHQKMLTYLNATPLLNLGLRLGEGTGSALALPLIQSAVNFLNEMASFDSAEVSEAL